MDKNTESEETKRRIELERMEINAAYDTGYSIDMNDSNPTSTNTNIKSNKMSNKNNTSKSYSSLIISGTTNSTKLNNSEYQDRTDRYGFIHDEKLPSSLTDIELKRNKIEKIREKKWITMLKDWNSYSNVNTKHNDKLVSRVFKGIPDSMRNQAWQRLLEIETQIKAQTGVYEKMRTLARQYSSELRQIDLDINRTFRNNLAYKKRYCHRQVQLFNILAAYSIYNTEIGYCQGMSTLTALLLMYLSDEEKTFWALSQLMSNNKYSIHGFFKRDFPKLIRYTDKHDMIIKTLLPKVHKKFLNCNITSLLYTTKWFLQCYLDALPFSLVLRVWDVYLLKGDIAVLAMSYCILKMHKKRLLQKEFDMDKINEFLNHRLPEDFIFSDDKVMIKLELCIEKLTKFKFPTGYIMSEPIPKCELAQTPFGDFKKLDKNGILNQIARKSTETTVNRDALVGQLAKDRLETELKKRDERRTKRREERLARGEIPNISDDDFDDDDYNYEHEDDDDDDDDDEKAEKESLMSNLTRPPTPQRSFSEFLSRSRISLTNHQKSEVSLRKDYKQDSNTVPHVRSSSEYENMLHNSNKLVINGNPKQSTSVYDTKAPSPVKSMQSPSVSKQSKYDIINNNNNNQPLVVQIMGSPIKKPIATISPLRLANNQQQTASVISNPPPISPSAFLSQSPQQKSSITSVISHPVYYQPHEQLQHQQFQQFQQPQAYNNFSYDYMRSPHGIYTRINKMPQQQENVYTKSPSLRLNNTAYSHLPQSSSSFIISSAAAAAQQQLNNYNNNSNSSKYTNNNNAVLINNNNIANHLTIPASSSNKQRTSSLRNVNNNRQNLNLVNNSPPSNTNATICNNNANYVRVNTPTKQQLQNHSLRIANIQQQQMSANHYPTISIISQTPISPSKQHQPHVTSAYQIPPLPYHRSASSHSSAFSNNRFNNVNNDDIIEQYDYI